MHAHHFTSDGLAAVVSGDTDNDRGSHKMQRTGKKLIKFAKIHLDRRSLFFHLRECKLETFFFCCIKPCRSSALVMFVTNGVENDSLRFSHQRPVTCSPSTRLLISLRFACEALKDDVTEKWP